MLDKFVNMLRGTRDGIDEPIDIDQDDIENDIDQEEETTRTTYFGGPRQKSKIVNYPQTNQNPIQMVISQPTSFEQSDEICTFLKEKKSIILNLEYVNKDTARRIIDFVSGGSYCLNGHIQKVSNSIFLVAPSNYEIENEMAKDEVKSKLNVSWIKNNGINN